MVDKFFKRLQVALSYILIAVTALLVLYIPPYLKTEKKIDLFSSDAIIESIKNLEMNMTSIVYVQDNSGNWVEYKRLHGEENRIWVGFDKMPKNLKNAIIAIEDETFYDHEGINWKRTMGAIGNFIFQFDDTEFGGSTITQQLIKNITMDKGKNATRKVREIIRAALVEKGLSKDQILEAYLNTIALGNGICGVEVAANYYFNKSVDELTLLECASLASITQNPSKYNPVTGMEANKERRNTVLQKMLELGFITEEEYISSYNVDITLDDTKEEDLEPEINNYFMDALIDEVITDLTEKYGCTEQIASSMLYNGGYKIYATVKPEVQEAMEKVYQNTDKYFKLTGKNLAGETVHVQSAMTIMDYNGHIVGLVGGAGEKTVNRGLNRATEAPRQPGSTMKPIGVYTLAVENDLIHYTSKVLDQPIKNYYPDGRSGPREWYGAYKDTITVDYAIRKSANTIPVRLLQQLGVESSYEFLTQKLKFKHLTEEDKNYSSLALGGCIYGVTTTESASAYAIYGNGGVYHEPTTYYKVEGREGEILLEYNDAGEQVITPATATIMNHLLQEVVYGSEGTGGSIRGYSSMRAFAKTGTSSESNDLWMVAGTPYYVGSVWYGFDKQQQVKSTSAAATIWRDVMKEVHTGLKKITFKDSPDVYKKGAGYYKKGTTPNNLETITGASSEEEDTTPITPPVASTPSTNEGTTSEGTTSSETSSEPENSGNEGDSGTVDPPESSVPTDAPENSEPSEPPPEVE